MFGEDCACDEGVGDGGTWEGKIWEQLVALLLGNESAFGLCRLNLNN